MANFVTRSGSQLVLAGNPFRFSGPNIFWLGLQDGDTYPTTTQIDDVLATAKEMGATGVRSHTLGISVGNSQSVWPSLGVTNTAAFATMDYAIYKAGLLGLKLVIPLTDNYHFYHGGKHTFTDWRSISDENQFYTDATVISDFESYISTILTHINSYNSLAYKDDPTIMIWETGNELSSPNPPLSWTRTISAYIKSIDANHLVMDGTYGIYIPSLSIPNVDIYSDHLYPRDLSLVTSDTNHVSNPPKDAWLMYGVTTTSNTNLLVRFSFGSTTDQIAAVFRFTNTGNFYYAQWAGNNFLKFSSNANNTFADLASTGISPALTPGTFYWMRIVASGNTYSVRHWQYGTSEPGTWDLTVSDAVTPTSGHYGIYCKPVSLTAPVQFDSFTVTDNVSTTLGQDTFIGRTTSDGWGTGSDGQSWLAGSGSNFCIPVSVSSGEGRILALAAFTKAYAIGEYDWRVNGVIGQGTAAVDATTAVVGTYSAKATITVAEPVAFHVQFMQAHLSLVNGTTYAFSFYAKTDTPQTIEVTLQGGSPTFTEYYDNQSIVLTTSWTLYSFTFTMSFATDANVTLYYNIAKTVSNIWFDNVQLVPSGGSNLIANPSFETGDLSSWLLRENPIPPDYPTYAAGVEANTTVSGDLFWSLMAHRDTYGFIQHTDGLSVYYPGQDTSTTTEQQYIRTHCYTMAGLSVPSALIPDVPLFTSVTSISVAWRGVVGGARYELQYSNISSTGPWTEISNIYTDMSTPLVGQPNGWYRIRAYNVDGIAGSWSAGGENMTAPTDGYGIYEGVVVDSPATAAKARLDQIAAAGFSVVYNSELLFSHIADILSYIDYAQSVGLKVIVPLSDPAIWKNNTIATTYPKLYADSGNQSTDSGFTTYVVNQVKTHAGTWGYYVVDEPQSADHTAIHTHAGYISAADATHPRLIICGGNTSTSAVSGTSNPFYDCCDVIGDDMYPYGDTNDAYLDLATECQTVQSYATSHSIQSAMVLQSFAWSEYSNPLPGRCTGFPQAAMFPPAQWMRDHKNTVVSNCTPRIVLFWAYYALIGYADDPGRHWANLAWAIGISSSMPAQLAPVAQDVFARSAILTSWSIASDGQVWTRQGALTTYAVTNTSSGAQGTITGTTGAAFGLLGTLQARCSAYVYSCSFSNASSDAAGVILHYVDSNNYIRVEINNTSLNVVQVVSGASSTLGTTSISPSLINGERYYLKVYEINTSLTANLWDSQFGAEPSAHLSSTVTCTIPTFAGGQPGVYTNLSLSSHVVTVYSFSALAPAQSALYVSLSGSDNNNGSIYYPFLTIGRAQSSMLPGTTVYLMPGTYQFTSGSFSSINFGGSAALRAQIVSWSPLGAIIRTTGTSKVLALNNSYVDIIGLDIAPLDTTTANGIINSAGYNSVQRCYVHAVVAAGSVGIYHISNNGYGNDTLGNVVEKIGTGTDVQSAGVLSLGPNGHIQNNRIDNCAGIGAQLYGSAKSFTISNNLIFLCNTEQINVGQGTAGVTNDNTIVSNNILLYSNGSFAIRETGTTGTHNQYLNNLIFGGNTTISLQNGLTASGTLRVDPVLINYQAGGTGDYRLQPDSPCINAGTSTGAPTTDINNALRSLKANIDIGPYLFYHSALFPTTSRRLGALPSISRRSGVFPTTERRGF